MTRHPRTPPPAPGADGYVDVELLLLEIALFGIDWHHLRIGAAVARLALDAGWAADREPDHVCRTWPIGDGLAVVACTCHHRDVCTTRAAPARRTRHAVTHTPWNRTDTAHHTGGDHP